MSDIRSAKIPVVTSSALGDQYGVDVPTAPPIRGRYCSTCGHPTDRHEAAVEDEFVVTHGGVGYAYCQDIARQGESATVCACRMVIGTSPAARAALWPADRPSIATIPAPGEPLASVRLVSTEVITTNPITGQSDFDDIEITYFPERWLIDIESLRAYWLWWRGRGTSVERLSTLVAQDVADATHAWSVEVIVREAPRGGIATVASARLTRERS